MRAVVTEAANMGKGGGILEGMSKTKQLHR